MAPVGQRSAASSTLVAQLLGRFLLEHVEVAVAAHLEHLRAHLHAAAGGCADVVVDGHLHRTHLLVRSRALGRTVAVGLRRRGVDVAALRPGAVVEAPAGHVVDARAATFTGWPAGHAPSTGGTHVGAGPDSVGDEVTDGGDRRLADLQRRPRRRRADLPACVPRRGPWRATAAIREPADRTEDSQIAAFDPPPWSD